MKLYIFKHTLILLFAFILIYKFKSWVEKQDGLLRKILMPIGYLAFAVGYVYDIFVNHLLTLIFLDFPIGAFETVTERMRRYKTLRDGSFKYITSVKLCDILNEYAPEHC